MPHQYRFLTRKSIPELYQAFIEAFSDYAIDMGYMSAESLLNRVLKNGIDFELSVAAYDNGKMVGFTMIGVDHRNSGFSAFDIGTGIIKPYRGKGIAKEMFSYAVPKLKEKGVKKFCSKYCRRMNLRSKLTRKQVLSSCASLTVLN